MRWYQPIGLVLLAWFLVALPVTPQVIEYPRSAAVSPTTSCTSRLYLRGTDPSELAAIATVFRVPDFRRFVERGGESARIGDQLLAHPRKGPLN